MKIYGAYGANTNMKAMSYRCPDAEFLGIGFLKDWQLEFRSVADIVPKKDVEMTIALWAITDRCEAALDAFEGYPNLYIKRNLPTFIDPEYSGGHLVTIDNPTNIEVVYYVMNPNSFRGNQIVPPPESYYKCLYEGYEDCGIPLKQLFSADNRATKGQTAKKLLSRNWG